jgi:ubiquinone/menaquinone biosynthesis C-methylase UbiE
MHTNVDQKKFFDKQARTWHHNIDEKTKYRLNSIFKNKIPPLRAPLLDIGSGTGILLPELHKNYSDTYPVYEADYSWNMLNQNRSTNENYHTIKYIQTDSHELPFKGNQFGGIVCFAAFAHFMDKPRAVQEFHRVLKPNGKLIILHLMCHIKLNEMHSQVGGAVKNDYLPAVGDLSLQLAKAKFSVLNYEEDKTLYLIIAQK